MSTPKLKRKLYVVDIRHDYCAEAEYTIVEDLDQAADVVAEFMEVVGFKLKNDRLFDPSNEPGDGFRVFSNVQTHKGRPVAFMHCGGDGPCVRTVSAANSPK